MDFSAKTKLGQHFLHDKGVAQRIVRQLSAGRQNILEIGPGKGILTQYLEQRPYHQLYLVEVDETLISQLQERFPHLKENIIANDILKMDWSEVFATPLTVIGNFPYQISSPLMFKILGHKEQVPEVVGMFQKEVAQRLAASAGSKIYGITSVLIQTFYKVDLLFKVGKGAFKPPPQVTSAVLRMTRNNRTSLSCSFELYRNIVRSTFQHRRKMLRNTLKPWLNKNVKQELVSYLKQRPEQLVVDDFIHITQTIEKHQ